MEAEAMEIDSLEIRKVDKDTELAEKLLDFVENFSWEEVKEHTVMMIKTGDLRTGRLCLPQ